MNLWYYFASLFAVGIVSYAYGYGHAFDKWQKAYMRLVKGQNK